MRKSKIKLPVKSLVVIAIILLALIAILGYIWNFLNTSDYFRIREVLVRSDNPIDLSYLKGKNIFRINLEREAAYIKTSFPDCSKVSLVRVLPNRIFALFVKRKPVAWVKLYRNFAIDQEGVFFSYTPSPEEVELPVITGLETKIFGPKPGNRYNLKELKLGLDIIRELRRNRILKNLKVKKIDVSSIANASVYFALPVMVEDPRNHKQTKAPDYLEVKLGGESVRDKVMMLSQVMFQTRNELRNVKYIDLRFKEAVIKFK